MSIIMEDTSIAVRMDLRLTDKNLGINVMMARMPQLPLRNSIMSS